MQKATDQAYLRYITQESTKDKFDIERERERENMTKKKLRKEIYVKCLKNPKYREEMTQKIENEEFNLIKRLKILSNIARCFGSTELINNRELMNTCDLLVREHLTFYPLEKIKDVFDLKSLSTEIIVLKK